MLIEAAAASAAVITTDVPGCRDAIVPEVTGLLVPAGDADALTQAIESLVTDRPRSCAMGVAGRALAAERFAQDRIIAQQLTIYETLFASA